MAKRIKILPNIKAAYVTFYEHRKCIFTAAWFPLCLIIILHSIQWFFPEISIYLYSLSRDYSLIFSCIPEMLELCLCAIIFVAVFRKILLSEDIPARSFSFKRGLEQKTVFTFKPYFRFGKREAAYAALNILFIIVFTGSADWYREARFEAIIESGAKNLDLSPYDQVFIIGLVIRILEFIAMSACIFLWPYIALTDKIRWSEIKQKLAGTRDNIGRIMLVILIMYLPYEAAYKTLFNLWLSINENVEEGLSLYIKIAVDAVRIIIYYICTLCEVAFISNLWKSLINNEVKEQK